MHGAHLTNVMPAAAGFSYDMQQRTGVSCCAPQAPTTRERAMKDLPESHGPTSGAQASLPHLAALLRRHDVPVPRYTSYPPIPYWHAVAGAEAGRWLEEAAPASLSLYTHIPFCERRCAYCGCFVVITPHREPVASYLDLLLREMSLTRSRLREAGPVVQYHLGGGTPTRLTPQDLSRLVAHARALYPFAPDAELSIEVDPRTVNGPYLGHLRALGFNRLSFGVQDVNPAVQAAVHRVQPIELVEGLMTEARKLDFRGINMDLIHGLPRQTPETFAGTVRQVLALRPDRLALYNFAYLPRAFAHQRQIDPAELPGADDKLRIMLEAHARIAEGGYTPIGMDHFALADDALAVAAREGSLRRNFMGYTTRAGTDVLAFGISGISALGGHYWQNEKKLAAYRRRIEGEELPAIWGMTLSEDDRLREAIVSAIFCQGKLSLSELTPRFGEGLAARLSAELEALAPLEADGLLVRVADGFRVTETGRHFLRNIAVVFDAYAGRTAGRQVTFSRSW